MLTLFRVTQAVVSLDTCGGYVALSYATGPRYILIEDTVEVLGYCNVQGQNSRSQTNHSSHRCRAQEPRRYRYVNLFLCGNGENLLNNVLVNIESLERFLDHRSGGSNK